MNAGKNGASNVADPQRLKIDAASISADEFAVRLNTLGPFEPKPRLAVAVSGGPDSMALMLLAADWAKSKNGRVIALTVDHRLRATSFEEARQTAVWLTARDIDHHILTRMGPALTYDIQAQARAARYDLLTYWCRDNGVLHLLLAHHLDDQAETLLLRLGRGSGLNGLASMPAVADEGFCRLLRPLLSFPKSRLQATLEAYRQPSIEDPSNANRIFARVRVRQALPAALKELGMTATRLAETAERLGGAREALEEATERSLCRSVSLHPAGFARVDPGLLGAAPLEIRLRALAAVIRTIGGELYPPRFDRLQRLAEKMLEQHLMRASTLGGCRILPSHGHLIVSREYSSIPAAEASIGPAFRWDLFSGRIDGPVPAGLTIGALGTALDPLSRRDLRRRCDAQKISWQIARVLPAFRLQDRVVAVPHLSWKTADFQTSVFVRFAPRRSLTGTGFRAR